MTTEITSGSEDGVFTVGASNESEDYLLWQRAAECLGKSEIYFEWNNQSNGGYDLVSECMIDRDGVHVVLSTDRLVHFYFSELRKEDWHRFREGLEQMYIGSSDVLSFRY